MKILCKEIGCKFWSPGKPTGNSGSIGGYGFSTAYQYLKLALEYMSRLVNNQELTPYVASIKASQVFLISQKELLEEYQLKIVEQVG